MAIYHCELKIVGRSQGRSAVAAAAYRAGEKIENERDGQVHDFTQKEGIKHKEIIAPEYAPDWVKDRARLWNEVERVEKRKDAQLAKEVEVSLPRELSRYEQIDLVRSYVQDAFVSKGMIADICLHDKGDGNPHAHILLTTRSVSPEGFGKKNREWNPEFANKAKGQQAFVERANGFVKTADNCIDVRAAWSEYANRALERAGIQERIDHRSFKDQGIEDRVPTIHEGPHVREMESRKIQTDRGDLNRLAKEHNAIVVEIAAYRQKREARRERNNNLNPEERTWIAKAEKIIGQRATIQTLQEGQQQLQQKLEGLKQSESKLKQRLDPFKKAEGLFREIEQSQSMQEGSRGFHRMLNKAQRDKHRLYEQRISRAEAELQQLGFKDRAEFKIRRTKVEAYVSQELSAHEQARKEAAADYSELSHTEQLLKRVEIRTIAAQYPDWPGGAKHLNYEGAAAIKAINEKVGRVSGVKEIQAMYQQRAGQLQELQQKVKALNETESRLKGAHQWLEKYEKQHKEASKLFQSSKAKEQWRQEMETSFRMMKQFGIQDRADYGAQFTQHQRSLAQRPDMESQITRMQPGFNLLKGALSAIREANRQYNQEQAQQRRGPIRDIDQDKGYGR